MTWWRPARKALPISASYRTRSKPSCRNISGASAAKANTRNCSKKNLSQHQSRDDREARRDTVPAERFQAVTPNEVDERFHHGIGHDKRHHESDSDLYACADVEIVPVLVEIEDGRAQHRRHREIKG